MPSDRVGDATLEALTAIGTPEAKTVVTDWRKRGVTLSPDQFEPLYPVSGSPPWVYGFSPSSRATTARRSFTAAAVVESGRPFWTLLSRLALVLEIRASSSLVGEDSRT
jgi:hypothetical protein